MKALIYSVEAAKHVSMVIAIATMLAGCATARDEAPMADKKPNVEPLPLVTLPVKDDGAPK